MIRRTFAIASVALAGAIIIACAASDDELGPPVPPGGSNDSTAPEEGEYTWDRPTGEVGTRQRKARGSKCCYKDKFYTCKKEADCYGGFDFAACIESCGEDEDCAYGKCRDQLYRAAPPTSDCVESEMPKVQEESDDGASTDDDFVPADEIDDEEIGEDDAPFDCDYSM